jgi:RNA polymerase sigma-70 factor (ECF subfamily)
MIFLAYLRGVEAAPLDPVEESVAAEESAGSGGVHPGLLNRLWHECNASSWGLERGEFDRIVLVAGMAQNFGAASGLTASEERKASFFREIKLDDLVLAKACAGGNERAWEHFVAIYSQPLTRAAIAISGSETVGRDLADALYAELYGLNDRGGERRCPLDSYRGRGSLLGWLRTTLAQRFVDHHRRKHREEPLDEFDAPAPDRTAEASASSLPILARAVEEALQRMDAEERFILAAYYLDGRTLAQIASLLHVHEATVSRRMRRATESVRKDLLGNLQRAGKSRRAAEEALGTDPRDLELRMDMRKLLQRREATAFSEKGGACGSEASPDTTMKKTDSDKAAG